MFATRKVLTKEKNAQDKIDAVLTHPIGGLAIFGLMMFLVFHISQSEVKLGLGKVLEGIFTGWLESFQGVVAEMVSGAAPILQVLLVDGIIGGVAAVVGFLPLVMMMYFLIVLKINQMEYYAFIDWKDNMDTLDDAPSVYYPMGTGISLGQQHQDVVFFGREFGIMQKRCGDKY